jgi:hypothetical protein
MKEIFVNNLLKDIFDYRLFEQLIIGKYLPEFKRLDKPIHQYSILKNKFDEYWKDIMLRFEDFENVVILYYYTENSTNKTVLIAEMHFGFTTETFKFYKEIDE